MRQSPATSRTPAARLSDCSAAVQFWAQTGPIASECRPSLKIREPSHPYPNFLPAIFNSAPPSSWSVFRFVRALPPSPCVPHPQWIAGPRRSPTRTSAPAQTTRTGPLALRRAAGGPAERLRPCVAATERGPMRAHARQVPAFCGMGMCRTAIPFAFTPSFREAKRLGGGGLHFPRTRRSRSAWGL